MSHKTRSVYPFGKCSDEKWGRIFSQSETNDRLTDEKQDKDVAEDERIEHE